MKKKFVLNERCDFVDLLLRFYLFQQRMYELTKESAFFSQLKGEFDPIDDYPEESYFPVERLNENWKSVPDKVHKHYDPSHLEKLINFKQT